MEIEKDRKGKDPQQEGDWAAVQAQTARDGKAKKLPAADFVTAAARAAVKAGDRVIIKGPAALRDFSVVTVQAAGEMPHDHENCHCQRQGGDG